MRSFELPIDRWRDIERDLKIPLDEIEVHRSRFFAEEALLKRAVESLQSLGLGAPFDFGRLQKGTDYAAVPYAEKLAFEKRHAKGTSAEDYRKMRIRIGKEYNIMPLTCDLLREIHKHAVGVDNATAGQWKTRKNFFPVRDSEGTWVATRVTVPARDVPEYMEGLHGKYHESMDSRTVDPILWIAAYALDLFAIHPFHDGNGRVTRLALLLTLNQAGHHVAKYINLEGAFARRRSGYIEAIIRSYEDWFGARHDPSLWCKFIVDFVLDSYREFSYRTEALTAVADQTAVLFDTITEMRPTFQIADLTERLPDVSEAIATIVLHRMKERGILQMSVHDKGVEWHKKT